MKILGDKWHRFEVDFKLPEDRELDESLLYTKLGEAFGEISIKEDLHIDCEGWSKE